MNLSPQMPSDLRLVIPATSEEMYSWTAQREVSHHDIFLIAAASRLDVLPAQVMVWQRSLMKVTLMSALYGDDRSDTVEKQRQSR